MEQDVTVKIPRTWIKGLPEDLYVKVEFPLAVYREVVSIEIRMGFKERYLDQS